MPQTPIQPANIHPVTPQEFATKIAHTLMVLTQVIGSIIMPLAGFILTVSIIMFILGSIFHASTLRRAGAGGMIGVVVGVLLYYAIPTILGVLQIAAQSFK
ncbi:hypothetical protein O163_10120 [Caldanaerobacter subterraneus subsp. yonseiensis KB-1]|uniref:Uncharacterized protein n=1 Tax=Caldanaerobacter subterraneus subsp. yonseiensis KB-1 TaxID=1388761 RepID=U5CP14_CALSX|nr:hypothetical protein [Caldanaerobacter subterraneus]ERM91519.1 hypothetical protein O163_10120 [Caldanaerobacter subterraneus subsp. yonseiensis KB-1]